MKKISTFALIATLFSTGTFAAPESKDASKEQKNESAIYLSVFDRTQEPSPDLNKKETSCGAHLYTSQPTTRGNK